MLRFFKYFLFLACLVVTTLARAFPLSEKTPATGSAPFEILSSQPDRIFIPHFGDFKDALAFAVFESSTLVIIDLGTFDEFATQPEAFTANVVDVALLPNGTSLIIALSDGNLARIELDDTDTFENTDNDETTTAGEDEEDQEEEPDSRRIDIADKMTTAAITHMVADPVDDIVYMVNSSGFYFQYNVKTNTLTEVELTGSVTTTTDEEGVETTTTTNFTPTDIVFAKSSSGDKILISTDTGDILVLTPGSSSFDIITNDSTAVEETPNFAEMALTEDNDFAFIVDTQNDVIWVFEMRSESFVDQQSGGTSLDPIEVNSTANANFTNIVLFRDGDDNEVAYVSGESGLTVIDARDPGSAASDSKVIDADDTNSTSEDPIPLSATPGPLAATTTDAGYVFSFNGDASLSVLTENPWITISSIDPSEVTKDSPTFTVTFQSDTAGDYTIRVNSNLTGQQGTELIGSTSFTDTDTDITTDSIDINDFERATFLEGDNQIFVFVTDANGNLGHAAAILNVDRPPEPITITGVNFGNKKAFVSFEPSPDADIASYQIFAEPATDQSSPTCPGSLTFASANTVLGEISPEICEENSCVATIQPLTNDVTYCLAVKAVDNAGNESTLSAFSTPVTPEKTVGPAAFFGETSCALNPGQVLTPGRLSPGFAGLLILTPLAFLLLARRLRKGKGFAVLLFLLLLLPQATAAQNKEATPQNFTAELKASLWFPTDSGMKDFVGTCCNFGGEIEVGYLLKNRYNVTVSVGTGVSGGSAVGIRSGGASADSFTLLMIPVRADFIYRFDFKTDQLFLPYVRAGGDSVIFRETAPGETVTNVKFGVHGGAGVGILLDKAEAPGYQLEYEAGINDVYLVLEGRYAMINSFKSTGLDLSGFYPYLGVLFEF